MRRGPPRLVLLARDIAATCWVIARKWPSSPGALRRPGVRGRRLLRPYRRLRAAGILQAFTNAFCDRHHLAPAVYLHLRRRRAAKAARAHFAPPMLVKADGLASGTCGDRGGSLGGRGGHRRRLRRRVRGGGRAVVIAEFLEGEIGSCSRSGRIKPRCCSRLWPPDHNAAFDGDDGPNTGGMGPIGPAPSHPRSGGQIDHLLVAAGVQGIAQEGAHPNRGVLFASS